MGWYQQPFSTRKGLIEELTETRKTVAAGGWGSDLHALHYCYRGNHFSGVLWTVWEKTFTRDGVEISPPERWIGCDLLEYWKKHEGWAYKPLDECMHPNRYSCPLSYLAMVPEDKYPDSVDLHWRESVRKYHAAKLQKRREKRSRLNV